MPGRLPRCASCSPVDNPDRTGAGRRHRDPAARSTRAGSIGRTTAGLPLRPGEHYERCPVATCGTVYRSKRRTRFRCPGCHRLAYALPVPDGATYLRRSVEGDPAVYRIIPRRGAEGEAPDPGDDTAALFLEDPEAAPPAPAGDPSPAPGPAAAPLPSPTERRAAAERERGSSRLGRLWRGSLGDLRAGRQ